MTGRGSGEPDGDEAPARAAARAPGGPEPVESADVREAGLPEPHRAALSASLGVILGAVLAELGRRRERKAFPSR